MTSVEELVAGSPSVEALFDRGTSDDLTAKFQLGQDNLLSHRFRSHSAPKKAGSWLLIETNIGAFVSKINRFGESRQFGFGLDGGR